MSSPVLTGSNFQTASAAAFSTATRVAGIVIALGYLLGLVGGPVVAVVGALGLMTYGRSVLVAQRAAIVTGAALAVMAGALGVAALRWGALDLGALRGVQSVLGPTLLVGPVQSAVATTTAAAAAMGALAVWLAAPWPESRVEISWALAEGAVGAFAIVTVFFDPARSAFAGGDAASIGIEIARWVGAVVIVTAVTGGAAWLLHKGHELWRAAVAATAGTAVVVAAALLMGAP
ncbi:MAG: hypothetical protein M3N53_04890 [Actinomycetota bacterium]|nr:hypothetical protein [Actinomycetota bacterium]